MLCKRCSLRAEAGKLSAGVLAPGEPAGLLTLEPMHSPLPDQANSCSALDA